MEELCVLIEQMVVDGEILWCIGLGLGVVIGWLVIDWVEDIMLCIQLVDVYDGWIINEVVFNDLCVVVVIEEFGWFVCDDVKVLGGVGVVVLIDFCDSLDGMFVLFLQCFMYCQVLFVLVFFLEDVEFGVDVDFFYFLLYVDKDLGNLVLGGGILMVIISLLDVINELMEFFKLLLVYEVMMVQIGFLILYIGVNLDIYMNDVLCGQGEIFVNVIIFCFDGLDLMLGGVGVGIFWIGMVDYVGGKDV